MAKNNSLRKPAPAWHVWSDGALHPCASPRDVARMPRCWTVDWYSVDYKTAGQEKFRTLSKALKFAEGLSTCRGTARIKVIVSSTLRLHVDR